MRGVIDSTTCPSCSYANDPGQLACGMCGHVFGRAPTPERSDGPPISGSDLEFDIATDPPEPWQRGVVVLALGAVIAPAFGLLPLVSMMGWFLSSLCHEIGHSVVAWFFGMPAYPAIRLDGHAASIHQPQKLILVLMVWGSIVASAWFVRRRLALLALTVSLAIVYPLLAWSNGREVLHLLGGHLGEYAFATVFLWRALDGGFSQSSGERLLYSAIGWYLIGHNVALCFGLATSSAAIAEYRDNGSFGLTNDYLRLAQDVLHAPLATIAIGMLLIAVLAPLIALGAWAMRRARAETT